MTLKLADAHLAMAGDAIYPMCNRHSICISEFSIVVAKILNYLVEVISKCPVMLARRAEGNQHKMVIQQLLEQSNSFLKQHLTQFDISQQLTAVLLLCSWIIGLCHVMSMYIMTFFKRRASKP